MALTQCYKAYKCSYFCVLLIMKKQTNKKKKRYLWLQSGHTKWQLFSLYIWTNELLILIALIIFGIASQAYPSKRGIVNSNLIFMSPSGGFRGWNSLGYFWNLNNQNLIKTIVLGNNLHSVSNIS